MNDDSGQVTNPNDPTAGGANIPSDQLYNSPQQPYPGDQYEPDQDINADYQPEPVSGGGLSPEIPTSSESGEQIVQPEVVPEKPKSEETQKEKVSPAGQEQASSEESVSSPEQKPDEYVFESPFSVYGYQASKKVFDQAKKGKGRNAVSGDVSFARTWLLVLLGKLIKIKEEK